MPHSYCIAKIALLKSGIELSLMRRIVSPAISNERLIQTSPLHSKDRAVFGKPNEMSYKGNSDDATRSIGIFSQSRRSPHRPQFPCNPAGPLVSLAWQKFLFKFDVDQCTTPVNISGKLYPRRHQIMRLA